MGECKEAFYEEFGEERFTTLLGDIKDCGCIVVRDSIEENLYKTKLRAMQCTRMLKGAGMIENAVAKEMGDSVGDEIVKRSLKFISGEIEVHC